MSWFVDASAIVAIMGVEDDWETVADRLDEEDIRLWSPVSYWESVPALVKRLKMPVEDVRVIVAEFAALNRFQFVSIGSEEGALAIDALMQFGKGSGHPARLNLGDCFAYACAKTNQAKLLYKGNDFAQTDLA